jgi:hypothetical protein
LVIKKMRTIGDYRITDADLKDAGLSSAFKASFMTDDLADNVIALLIKGYRGGNGDLDDDDDVELYYEYDSLIGDVVFLEDPPSYRPGPVDAGSERYRAYATGILGKAVPARKSPLYTKGSSDPKEIKSRVSKLALTEISKRQESIIRFVRAAFSSTPQKRTAVQWLYLAHLAAGNRDLDLGRNWEVIHLLYSREFQSNGYKPVFVRGDDGGYRVSPFFRPKFVIMDRDAIMAKVSRERPVQRRAPLEAPQVYLTTDTRKGPLFERDADRFEWLDERIGVFISQVVRAFRDYPDLRKKRNSRVDAAINLVFKSVKPYCRPKAAFECAYAIRFNDGYKHTLAFLKTVLRVLGDGELRNFRLPGCVDPEESEEESEEEEGPVIGAAVAGYDPGGYGEVPLDFLLDDFELPPPMLLPLGAPSSPALLLLTPPRTPSSPALRSPALRTPPRTPSSPAPPRTPSSPAPLRTSSSPAPPRTPLASSEGALDPAIWDNNYPVRNLEEDDGDEYSLEIAEKIKDDVWRYVSGANRTFRNVYDFIDRIEPDMIETDIYKVMFRLCHFSSRLNRMIKRSLVSRVEVVTLMPSKSL